MDKVIVIGIAGGTGSGKSTMIRKIKEEFMIFITRNTAIYLLRRERNSIMIIPTPLILI